MILTLFTTEISLPNQILPRLHRLREDNFTPRNNNRGTPFDIDADCNQEKHQLNKHQLRDGIPRDQKYRLSFC